MDMYVSSVKNVLETNTDSMNNVAKASVHTIIL